MEEWSEWRELNGGSLTCDVADVFAYEWDTYEVEYRMQDGSVMTGQVWVNEEPFTYTTADGEEVEDYDRRWYIENDQGNEFDMLPVVAWRYKK